MDVHDRAALFFPGSFSGRFRLPQLQHLSVQKSVGAGPGIQSPDHPLDLHSALCPVDKSCGSCQHLRVRSRALFGLRRPLCFSAPDPVHRQDQLICSCFHQLIEQASSGLIISDRNCYLVYAVSCVKALCHLHDGHSGLFIPCQDRPLDRSRPSPLWKKRRMNIQAAVLRNIQNALRYDLSEGRDHDIIRLQFPENLYILFPADLLRLVYRDVMFKRQLFDRRGLKQSLSSLRAVRLREHSRHCVIGIDKRLQNALCKIGRSHKNNVSQCSVSRLCFNPQLPLRLLPHRPGLRRHTAHPRPSWYIQHLPGGQVHGTAPLPEVLRPLSSQASYPCPVPLR